MSISDGRLAALRALLDGGNEHDGACHHAALAAVAHKVEVSALEPAARDGSRECHVLELLLGDEPCLDGPRASQGTTKTMYQYT